MIVALAPLGLVTVVLAATSALAVLALRLVDASRIRLAAQAHARVVFAVVLAPGLLAVSFTAGTWLDHHVLGCDAHQCLRHVEPGPLAIVLACLGALLVARVGLQLARVLRTWRRGQSLVAELERCSVAAPGYRILPGDGRDVFVAGFTRARVFVAQRLVETAGPAELDAALEHERAHVRRRDPLRRLLASAALAFHLPGVAAWLETRLVRAIEMAADADAAAVTGDRLGLAAALVRFARLQLVRPLAMATSFAADDVEARVRRLLEPGGSAAQPSPGVAIAVGCMAVGAVLFTSEPLHDALEAALRVLFL